jgi:transposase
MGTARNAEILIAEPPVTRRYRSKRERRQIVEETLQPGASVAVIARRHDVNANQVFHWRKLYREGRLDVAPASAPLLPVRVAEVVNSEPPPAKLYAGVIVVEVGRARVRIEGPVDADNLRLVLERVGR